MKPDVRTTSCNTGPARVGRLNEDAGDDLSTSTTPAERLEMVNVLSQRMWELMGRETPHYARASMPVKLARRT